MEQKFPSEILQPLYSAIGEFVTVWSTTETTFNIWLAIIYQGAGGKHYRDRIPFGLTQKVKFLRKCFNQITALEPFSEDGKNLLARAKTLAQTRDMLVHGSISEYNEHTQELLFRRIDLNSANTMQVVSKTSFTIRQILENSGEVIELGAEATVLAAKLAEAFVTDSEMYEFIRDL